MIVSVGIFSVVMLIVTGAYLALIDLDRKARATNQLVASLSFALDSMARAIRTGTAYACSPGPNNTDGTCHQISFTDSNIGQTVTYRLNSNGTIGSCTGSGACNDSTAIELTDRRIAIGESDLTFYVQGVGTGDGIQPYVIISVRGKMQSGNTSQASTTFSVQTSAAQRLPDL